MHKCIVNIIFYLYSETIYTQTSQQPRKRDEPSKNRERVQNKDMKIGTWNKQVKI